MATRVCNSCGSEYDDVYRVTYCPHPSFGMHTVATNGKGETKVCTTIAELNEHLGTNFPCH